MMKTVNEIRALIKSGNPEKVRLSSEEVNSYVSGKPENRKPAAKLALIDAGLVNSDAPILEAFPKSWY